MQYLSEKDQAEIRENLSYLYIDELKVQLQELGLSLKGFNKNELIEIVQKVRVLFKQHK